MRKQTDGNSSNDPKRRPGWIRSLGLVMQKGGSAGWLIITLVQAVITLGLIGIARLAEGFPWEPPARMLVIVGIVGTWSMALRTIRARLVELLCASSKLLKRASGGGLKGIPQTLRHLPKGYLKKSIFHLRMIAMGITMPLFILPLFTSAICLSLCWHQSRSNVDMLGMAMVLTLMGTVVGVYFHWSILPPPTPIPIRQQRSTSVRMRKRRMSRGV